MSTLDIVSSARNDEYLQIAEKKSIDEDTLKIASVQLSTLLVISDRNYQYTKLNSYEAVKQITNLQKYEAANIIPKSFEIYSNLNETQFKLH